MKSTRSISVKLTLSNRAFRLILVGVIISFFGVIVDYNFIQSSYISAELQGHIPSQRVLLCLVLTLMTIVLVLVFEVPQYLQEKTKSREREAKTNLQFLESTDEQVLYKKTHGGDFDSLKIFERFNLGVLIVDNRGIIKSANPEFQRKTGYNSKELVGSDAVSILGDQKEKEQGRIKHRSDGNAAIYQHSIRHKNGEEGHYYTAGMPLYDRDNRVAGSAGVILDITDMHNYQNQLKKALKLEIDLSAMKTRFVTLASHEFRTPLSIIQANAELLSIVSTSDADLHQRKRFKERISNEIKYMTKLMNEILLYEKISLGAIQTNKTVFSLPCLCNEVLNTINDLKKTGEKVNLVIHGDSKEVLLDRKLLKRAIKNILSNATKFSKGAPVDFSLYYQQDFLKIAIVDKGIGVPAEEIKNVFNPFFRGSNIGNIRGAGLGIGIAKEHVLLNGGTLELESEPSRGTKVTITFGMEAYSETQEAIKTNAEDNVVLTS